MLYDIPQSVLSLLEWMGRQTSGSHIECDRHSLNPFLWTLWQYSTWKWRWPMINTTPKERQPEKLRGTKEMKTTAKEKEKKKMRTWHQTIKLHKTIWKWNIQENCWQNKVWITTHPPPCQELHPADCFKGKLPSFVQEVQLARQQLTLLQ